VICTTAEHPFYTATKGWVDCRELAVGDLLLCEGGGWVAVEDLLDTGEVETVYNMRVADHHTYFVGEIGWGCAVWAHNLCWYFPRLDSMGRLQRVFGKVRPADLGTGTGTNSGVRAAIRAIGNALDDAGHLIARRLGGPGHLTNNLFPQLRAVNRGQYRMFEQRIAQFVAQGNTVLVQIRLIYTGASTRPDGVVYTVWHGGRVVLRQPFIN
jgi:hypothetical protein